MIVTPELVEMSKRILNSGFEGQTLPFRDCFETSDNVTAKHILDEDLRKAIGHCIPKFFIYLMMDEVLGVCTGKDSKGYAGYHLSVKRGLPKLTR